MTEAYRRRPETSPFVGRERERALIVDVLDVAASGQGAFILIEGAAGIGKSRLSRHAASIAAERGFTILGGSSSQEERATAYAPFLDALRSLRVRDHGREIAGTRALHDLVAGALNDDDRLDAPNSTVRTDRRRVLDTMLHYIEQASGVGSLVILEDIHWADHATTRLLREVSQHAASMRCVFVLTYRDADVAANDALTDLLYALSASPVALHTLRLGPLTWPETRTMSQSVLDIAWMPPTAFVDHLYARAEGNPFFTEEILRLLPQAAYRADLRIPDELPVSIARLLENRIKRLPDKAVRALAIGAVLGRQFDQATLLKVGDLAERGLLKALRNAVDAQLIRDVGDGSRFEFQHALVREAAEPFLLSSERQALHERIAGELEARTAPSAESAAIAYHFGKAGLLGQHAHHAVAAADAAWRAGAPIEAARWYEQALEAGAEQQAVEPDTLLRRAAEAFAWAHNPKLAAATFEHLIEIQRVRGDALAEGETLAEFANMFHGDVDRRRELLERALGILEPLGETASLARVYARLSSLYLGASLAREAVEAGRIARDMARRTGAADAEAVAQRALGTIVAAGGDFADGSRRLRRSIELARHAHKHGDVYLSSTNLVNAAIRASNWDEAEATARASIDYLLEVGAVTDRGSLMSRLAEVLRLTGRLDEAHVTIDEALLLMDQDEPYIFNAALLVKAEVLADLGEWGAVRDLVEPMLPSVEPSRQIHVYGLALFLLARATFAAGDRSGAIQRLDHLLGEWRKTQDNYYGLPMLLFSVRLHSEDGALDAARSIIHELGDVPVPARTFDAILPAAQAWLANAEGRLDDAIPLWGESAAAFDALGRPVEAARSRLELGRALLARGASGDREEAKGQLLWIQTRFASAGLPEVEHAEALLRRHRLIVTRATNEGSPLTAREREIVALVAEGLTSRGMAERLTLSARTVDNHVTRILQKLELASRGQIVAYAIEHGISSGKSAR